MSLVLFTSDEFDDERREEREREKKEATNKMRGKSLRCAPDRCYSIFDRSS